MSELRLVETTKQDAHIAEYRLFVAPAHSAFCPYLSFMGCLLYTSDSMDEDNGMNFAEFVAILSGNTDLLNKAKDVYKRQVIGCFKCAARFENMLLFVRQ